jgi:RNA polymerase sigma-70 factor (ECF subfamily)
MASQDDHELIRACLSGQSEAFGCLVLRYQDRLLHTLTCVLGSREDAQDVAQEALVRAFRKLDTFRGDSAFYSWLFRIALNAAVTYQRRNRQPHASLEAGRESSGSEPRDPRADAQPSHSLETEERQRLVRAALARLPEEYRTALVLKEMEGLKYEEIAELVGCPIGTVRSRIHRAREELREKLRGLFATE